MVLTNVARVNGGGLFEIDTAAANVAISAAIATLGTDGGVIEIFPGDADYTFTGAVVSTASNVHIKGHGGVFKIDGSATTYMFRVQGQNWTFEGINFELIATAGFGSAQVKLISIEDAGTEGASDTTSILNCRFHATLATHTIENCICISAIGEESSSAEIRRGLLVSGCTFIAGVNSMPMELDDGSGNVHGITFVKTNASGSQRIVHNDFHGDVAYSTLANVPDGADPQLLEIAINATVAIGGSTVVLKSTATDPTLTGVVQPGSTFTVAGDAQVYKIVKQATAGSNTVSLTFYPNLLVEATLNDVVVLTQVTAYGHVASAISLTDHNQSIVSNNTFNLISCQAAAAGEGGALIHLLGGVGESGHSTISHNQIEDIDAWYIVRVEKGTSTFENLWTHTEWNNFGRIIPRCEAVVSYDEAGVARIVGNAFHNVEGGSHGGTATNGYLIETTDCHTMIIALNLCSIMDTLEPIWKDHGGNGNIKYLANLREVDHPA
jgi:hypothetical protein